MSYSQWLKSAWINITSGIPQGSVLGPVLFLVFINDLPDVIEVLMKLFADDAKIMPIYMPLYQIPVTIVQYSLNRAVHWANVWKTLFSIIKCHHLHTGKHDIGIKHTMISNNQEVELETVEKEKNLSVIIEKSDL